jgi:hypothetical protein
MKTRAIAAKGSLVGTSVFLADHVSWDSTPPDLKPARTRNCFGCAVSFSSFSFDDHDRTLTLSAASSPGELQQNLEEYRLFTDLGLDFVTGKEKMASFGNGPKCEPEALALSGDDDGLRQASSASDNGCAEMFEQGMDRGACIAAGYAVVPKIPADTGGAMGDLMALMDSAGLCPFLAAGIDTGIVAELLAAATGMDFSRDEIMQAGQRINRLLRPA